MIRACIKSIDMYSLWNRRICTESWMEFPCVSAKDTCAHFWWGKWGRQKLKSHYVYLAMNYRPSSTTISDTRGNTYIWLETYKDAHCRQICQSYTHAHTHTRTKTVFTCQQKHKNRQCNTLHTQAHVGISFHSLASTCRWTYVYFILYHYIFLISKKVTHEQKCFHSNL